MKNEALARIKINKLLESAGWRFFPDGKARANIQLEPSVAIKVNDLDALGDNFEKTEKGFIDFLLLNEKVTPSSFSGPNRKAKTRLRARSKRASTRDRRTADSSSSRTGTSTTSGIWNAETPM